MRGVDLDLLVRKQAFETLCNKFDIDLKTIEKSVIQELKEEASPFPENPEEGDYHYNFVYLDNDWRLITQASQ